MGSFDASASLPMPAASVTASTHLPRINPGAAPSHSNSAASALTGPLGTAAVMPPQWQRATLRRATRGSRGPAFSHCTLAHVACWRLPTTHASLCQRLFMCCTQLRALLLNLSPEPTSVCAAASVRPDAAFASAALYIICRRGCASNPPVSRCACAHSCPRLCAAHPCSPQGLGCSPAGD
jgi:hypothetical protein